MVNLNATKYFIYHKDDNQTAYFETETITNIFDDTSDFSNWDMRKVSTNDHSTVVTYFIAKWFICEARVSSPE